MSLKKNLILEIFGGRRNPLDSIEHGTGVPTHSARQKGIIYKDKNETHGYWISMNTSGDWYFILTSSTSTSTTSTSTTSTTTTSTTTTAG